MRTNVHKWNQRIALIMIAMIVGFSFSGCANINIDTNHAVDFEEEHAYTYEHFKALTDIEEGRPNLYLIVKNPYNNYWLETVEHVKKAANEQNCNVYWSSSEAEVDWQAQRDLLYEAYDAGADAVIIAPDNSSQLSESISDLHTKGMPIILIDTTLTTDEYDVCYMTDNLRAGQDAAKEMIEQLKKKGYTDSDVLQVAIQVGSTSSQTINERLAGFCQYWTKNTSDNWEILEEIKVNGGDLDYAKRLTLEVFNDNPNIHGVFGCNNGSTVGLSGYIYENERTDVVIVGFDYSDEIARLVNDDRYSASTMLQRQDLMAEYSVKSALDMLNGNSPEFKFVDTGIIIVNKDTVLDAEVQNIVNK